MQKPENAEITCIHILMIVEKVTGMIDKNIKKLCDICRLYTDIRLNGQTVLKICIHILPKPIDTAYERMIYFQSTKQPIDNKWLAAERRFNLQINRGKVGKSSEKSKETEETHHGR